MTECLECATAAHQPSNVFRVECLGCTARAVSRGQEYFGSKRDRRLNPEYIAVLEGLGLTHDQVVEARKADFLGRGNG